MNYVIEMRKLPLSAPKRFEQKGTNTFWKED